MGKQQKYEQVAYLFIKNQIIEGKWDVGHHIIENNISEQLNMSRSPIRAALAVLEKESVVEIKPYRGYFIEDLIPQQGETGFYVNYFLVIWYRLTDRLIKYHISVDPIKAKAKKLLKEMNTAFAEKDWETWQTKQDTFLRTIFSLCDHPFLEDELCRSYDIVLKRIFKDMTDDNERIDYVRRTLFYFEDFFNLFFKEEYIESRVIAKLNAEYQLTSLPSSERRHTDKYSPYTIA